MSIYAGLLPTVYVTAGYIGAGMRGSQVHKYVLREAIIAKIRHQHIRIWVASL